MTGLLPRLRRQLDFARHVPSRQMLRRAQLALRRRVEARLRPKLDAGALARSEQPPLPIFPPRTGRAFATTTGWRFRFLGREIEIPASADWRALARDDGDQLWRMNLHYMEYLEEVDDAGFAALVDGWIDRNPAYAPGSTRDSWNAYALALRVVVWMQQLARRSDRLESGFRARVEASLASQLRYLERHLETDVNGNHLIKDIKALLWASRYFDGGAADRWRRRGLSLLGRELRRQFLADGVHYELSPTYHCQVLADLIEIRHALGCDPLDGALDRVIEAAALAAADLAHPDGGVAQFADGGLNAAYRPAECLKAWRLVSGNAPTARPAFGLSASGYYGVRRDEDYFVADAGPLVTDAIPGHGHGDIFSFEWSVAGRRIVVDQGVFEYVAGARRHMSRTAACHNTLVVEGGDQADFYGAFRSSRRAKVERLAQRTEGDALLVEGRHDGFRRLAGAPLHRRRFEGDARRMRILDWIEGESRLPARISLLLAAGTGIERESENVLRLTNGPARARVSASLPIYVETAVWWPDMGVELATQRLIVRLGSEDRRAELELAALRI